MVQSFVNNHTGVSGTRHDHYIIAESVETFYTVEPLIYQASLTNDDTTPITPSSNVTVVPVRWITPWCIFPGI